MSHVHWSLLGVSVLLVSYGMGAAQSSGMRHGEMRHVPGDQTAVEVCRGFLVLDNGYAVMSGMSDTGPGSHGHGAMGHGSTSHGGMQASAMTHDKIGMGGMQHGTGTEDHLMGLAHGDGHPVHAGMLCVPVDASSDSWAAVGQEKGLEVTVRSLRGALHHNSRESEAFELALMDGKTPVQDAEVLLIARMPHHDRSLKGGHGLANDPDVAGIKATPAGPGRYMVPTADFSMGGPWLFEIQVKKGDELTQAYFATVVGEE